MKGPKKDKVKLLEQGVVTRDALIAYLHNELSPEEKQQLDKLLLEDPFARDALEGLQSSANQSSVTASISSLNKKVRERSGLKERKKLTVHWVTYAWAAVLIGLLIGIGFIMVNFLDKHESPLALNKTQPAEPVQVLKPAEPVANAEKIPAINADTAGKKASIADTTTKSVAVNLQGQGNAKNLPAPQANTGINTIVTTNGAVASGATQNATNITKTTAPAVAQNFRKADDKKTNGFTDSIHVSGNMGTYNYSTTSNYKQPAANKKEVSNQTKDFGTLQDEAMKSFNAGDYSTAADDFDKLLKNDPENSDALYFGGISDYINGKTAKSESNFDKLIKKGNKYMEGSKWYKANILLKKGKSDAAKTLLQDLSNTNGSYKQRAIKKLAELGF